VVGGAAADVLAGGAGDDGVSGGGGADAVSGGSGDDFIHGGGGADTLSGGTGIDTVQYGFAAAGAISLDGVANDGLAGENDNVGTDVEDVNAFSASSPVTITGSGAANRLVGDSCESVSTADVGNANEDKPPTVAWRSPASGAKFAGSKVTTLQATATDDKGVAKVVFMDDDRVVCTDTVAPYTCA
jgi:hypothetical protein